MNYSFAPEPADQPHRLEDAVEVVEQKEQSLDGENRLQNHLETNTTKGEAGPGGGELGETLGGGLDGGIEVNANGSLDDRSVDSVSQYVLYCRQKCLLLAKLSL